MSTPGPRIALIHATALAITPVVTAFKALWPAATLMNLLEDSLSVDRAAAGALTDAMVLRFIDLARYAKASGAQGILFTCSAFGPAIEAAGAAVGIPTLKPNEAMFSEALARASLVAGRSFPAGGSLAARGDLAAHDTARPARIGLIATFRASIDSMATELEAMAAAQGVDIQIVPAFVPGAMDALARGDATTHHQAVAAGVQTLAHCDVITLAQFSMAAAQGLAQASLARASSGASGTTSSFIPPVLASPACAVTALKEALDRVTA